MRTFQRNCSWPRLGLHRVFLQRGLGFHDRLSGTTLVHPAREKKSFKRTHTPEVSEHLGLLGGTEFKLFWLGPENGHQMALELVSGAGFWCKLMSRASPGDVGGPGCGFPA